MSLVIHVRERGNRFVVETSKHVYTVAMEFNYPEQCRDPYWQVYGHKTGGAFNSTLEELASYDMAELSTVFNDLEMGVLHA